MNLQNAVQIDLKPVLSHMLFLPPRNKIYLYKSTLTRYLYLSSVILYLYNTYT